MVLLRFEFAYLWNGVFWINEIPNFANCYHSIDHFPQFLSISWSLFASVIDDLKQPITADNTRIRSKTIVWINFIDHFGRDRSVDFLINRSWSTMILWMINAFQLPGLAYRNRNQHQYQYFINIFFGTGIEIIPIPEFSSVLVSE